MVKIKKLGSLYFDGIPVLPGSKLDEQQFSIGDTYPGMELRWVDDGSLLVADRCICTNVSWEQLDWMGLALGTPVWIDGNLYLCRCLKVGNRLGKVNEWDALLDKYGEDNSLWHWKALFFWGQETLPNWALHRAVRGWVAARCWSHYTATTRDMDVGFRPALKPLIPELSDSLVGSNINAFGLHGEIIEGQLVEYDDYDLVLDAEASSNCDWAVQQDRHVIISRKSLIGISDANK